MKKHVEYNSLNELLKNRETANHYGNGLMCCHVVNQKPIFHRVYNANGMEVFSDELLLNEPQLSEISPIIFTGEDFIQIYSNETENEIRTLYHSYKNGKYNIYQEFPKHSFQDWDNENLLIKNHVPGYKFEFMGKTGFMKYESAVIGGDLLKKLDSLTLKFQKVKTVAERKNTSIEYNAFINDIATNPDVRDLAKVVKKYYESKYGHLIKQKTK